MTGIYGAISAYKSAPLAQQASKQNSAGGQNNTANTVSITDQDANATAQDKAPNSASAATTYNYREAVQAINEENGTQLDVDVERRAQGAQTVLDILV